LKQRTTKLVWVSTAIVSAVLALGSWAFSSPVGSSPDDDFHNASIWCGQGSRDGLCEDGTSPSSVVVSSQLVQNCFKFFPEVGGACAISESFQETNRANLSGNYPGFYYWTMSWFASTDVPASILTMRFVNIFLAIGLLSLVITFLPRNLRTVPLVAVLGTAVPLGLFLYASVNPSSWGLFSVVIFFSAVLGFFASNNTSQKIVLGSLAGVSAVMGAGSRQDTPGFLLFAGLMAVFLSLSSKWIPTRKMLIIGVLSGLSILFLISTLLTQTFIGNFFRGAEWFGRPVSPESFFRNFLEIPDLIVGVFGYWGLGWLDTSLPSSVWLTSFGIFLGLIVSTMSSWSSRQKVAFAAIALALVAIPLYLLTVNGLFVGEVVQPRYLLPLLALALAVSVFKNPDQVGLQLSRLQFLIIGCGLVIANTISLHINMRRYLTGIDSTELSLNRGIEWWWVEPPLYANNLWFSPNNVWIGGSLAFAIFLIAIWKLRYELGFSNQKVKQKLSE
jgi:hypothetical protein